MKKILKSALKLLNSKLQSKQVFYYSPNENNAFGRTAVKTKFGFWYVGNVLDQKDIACGILNFGVIEPDETQLVLHIYTYLQHKNTPYIFDIGANTGYYSLLAAYFFKNNAEIYSFEPVQEYAQCIRESIHMNHFGKNIHVCNFALSNIEKQSTIYVSGTCSSLEQDFNDASTPTEIIELKKLDTFAKDMCPDFIKIDVEGHELATLEGGKILLSRCTPIVFIEIIQSLASHNFVNKNFAATIKIFTEIGYDAYIFKGGKLIPLDSSTAAEGVFMYLFVHKDKHLDFIKTLSIYQ